VITEVHWTAGLGRRHFGQDGGIEAAQAKEEKRGLILETTLKNCSKLSDIHEHNTLSQSKIHGFICPQTGHSRDIQ